MGTFSISHWLVILLIIVLLFGAKKIPDLAKGVGQGIKNFKKAMKEEETPTIENMETKNDTTATPTPPHEEKKSN